jgi:aldehyde dehydrogenase (NAD+)
VEWRKAQLKALRRLLVDHDDVFAEALRGDLAKGATESHMMELGYLVGEIDHILRHLDRWLRPARSAVPLALMPSRASAVYEPLGTVLVISPWNYPMNLTLAPVIGALAAGNCVAIKPSDVAPATSAALAELLPRVLDNRAVAVIEGGSGGDRPARGEVRSHLLHRQQRSRSDRDGSCGSASHAVDPGTRR